MSKWIDVKEKIHKKPAEICYCCCYNYVFYYHYFTISTFPQTLLLWVRYFKVKISKSFEKMPCILQLLIFQQNKKDGIYNLVPGNPNLRLSRPFLKKSVKHTCTYK